MPKRSDVVLAEPARRFKMEFEWEKPRRGAVQNRTLQKRDLPFEDGAFCQNSTSAKYRRV